MLYAVQRFECKVDRDLSLSLKEKKKYKTVKNRLLESISREGCGDSYIPHFYKDQWRASLQRKYHDRITAAGTIKELDRLKNRIEEIALLKYPFQQSSINCTHTAAHNRLDQSSSSQSETTEGVFYKGNISNSEYRGCSPIYVELLELIGEKRRKFASLHDLPKERKETTVFFAPSSFSQTTQAHKINPTKNKADGSFAAPIRFDGEVGDVQPDSKHESKTISPTIQQSDAERLQKENEQLKAELAREKARADALAAEVAALKAAASGAQKLSTSSQRGLEESMFNTSSRTATSQRSVVIHHPLASASTVNQDPSAPAASFDG